MRQLFLYAYLFQRRTDILLYPYIGEILVKYKKSRYNYNKLWFAFGEILIHIVSEA